MENDKKAYMEESEQMLKRQGNMIDKLKEENKQYCKDMVKSGKDQKRVTDVKKTANQCSSEIAGIKDAIDNEIALHKQIDDEMKSVQKQILEKKRMAGAGGGAAGKRDSGAAGGAAGQAQQNTKKIKILENRLDKANQKFNETISQNKVMREEIDNYRKEKGIFETLYNKLDKQVQQKRNEMNDIMEIANNTYEERDQIQNKLAGLIS